MQGSYFNTLLKRQRDFFSRGNTLPIEFRIEQLKKLKSLIPAYEEELMIALQNDLQKTPMESFISEIYLVLDEIDFMIAHLKKWARAQKVSSPFPLFWPGTSTIQFEPYGCVLIIAPWNYPFLLLMSPLIGAIAAG